jgi:hypothetical protein
MQPATSRAKMSRHDHSERGQLVVTCEGSISPSSENGDTSTPTCTFA